MMSAMRTASRESCKAGQEVDLFDMFCVLKEKRINLKKILIKRFKKIF